MNAISAFFLDNIIAVFFVYGLAFFTMGLALALAGRRPSEFRFATAILPLAGFGFLHGAHEWFEMFQKIANLGNGHTPGIAEEVVRLLLLALSFELLLGFGLLLVVPEPVSRRRLALLCAIAPAVWIGGTVAIAWRNVLSFSDALVLADALARYCIGIPAALLGAWALMEQQRAYYEHGMPQFGRDLVWSAAALLLYGAIGQLFVRPTVLPSSQFLNSVNFLLWFGIPVQLFRAVMASGLTFFLARALRAFAEEDRRRLEQANAARLEAQANALAAERRTSRQMEQLNEELRLTAHKLSLLLELSTLFNSPLPLENRLSQVLELITEQLSFADAGLILLSRENGQDAYIAVATGYADLAPPSAADDDYAWACELAQACITQGVALCRHRDGQILDFRLEIALEQQPCRRYVSPTTIIALPLVDRQAIVGSLTLSRVRDDSYRITREELALMVGIAQQLGLSVENGVLQQEALSREQMLGEMLHQVVGAQEAERQRIARELHDATGQALTAVALGLTGIETALSHPPDDDTLRRLANQLREIKSFGTNALIELRNIIADLRPPQLDDLGLIATLRWYVQAFEERRGIKAQFSCSGDEALLTTEYKTVLFRIAQEGLTNVAKHAEATEVEVTLTIQPLFAALTVADNGRGFDPEPITRLQKRQPAGWGLIGINERAMLLGGRCLIDSAPGRGTRLHVTVPLTVDERTPNADHTAPHTELGKQ